MTTDPTARGDTPMMTEAEIRALLDGLNVDLSGVNSGAPLLNVMRDLARTCLSLFQQLDDAEARGMEMALKTYRTGSGVDNGNYPLWTYDADYEAAVRKKAEVHRKAASDRAARKGT